MSKIYITAAALIASMILFSGCNGRQSFEPESTHSASSYISKHGRKAISVLRDGVTYDNGTYITRGGEGKIKIPEKFHFVAQSSSYVLAADNTGQIKILGRSSGKVIQEAKLDYPLISALIRGKNIYYISQDNVFGVYSMNAKKTTVSAKVGRAFAVDTRIANPISLGSLLIVPTLDGKLLVISPSNPRAARGMAIGSEYNMNNVIFLGKIGRTIIAATPRKLVSAAPGAMNKFEAPIADTVISGGNVYALTVDGRVVKLNSYLKVLAQKKFPYAQFAALSVSNGKVFALDRSGALIVMDANLKKSKIYDIGKVKSYSFAAGGRLYKDKEVVNLNSLSYE